MLLIIGIVLTIVGLAYICWLLFKLAVHALPVFVGASVAFAVYDSGSGPIAAFIVGLIGSGVTLAAAHSSSQESDHRSYAMQFRLSSRCRLLWLDTMPPSASRSSASRLTSGNTSWR